MSFLSRMSSTSKWLIGALALALLGVIGLVARSEDPEPTVSATLR